MRIYSRDNGAMKLLLGELQEAFDHATRKVIKANTIGRIWSKDHSVWQSDPTGVCDRLGWLDISDRMQFEIPKIEQFATIACSDEYTDVLLLGMGGASLAAEVLAKVFGARDGFLRLSVLDSIDSWAVTAQLKRINVETTLFVVSTKSGTTIETLSLFRHCHALVTSVVGKEAAGQHFIAITDPASSLAKIAEEKDFREIFFGDSNIGGRFSALSVFGLVPAALLGVNLNELLHRAIAMARCSSVSSSNAVQLGIALGVAVHSGRNKLTLLCDPALDSFGNWVEQLIAESTGKDNTGIVPVVGEPRASSDYYSEDRLFVKIQYDSQPPIDDFVNCLSRAGHPVVILDLRDSYDLAAQFFLWEMATAVAGTFLSINPFDQPNVELTKRYVKEIINGYQSKGFLPSHEPILSIDTDVVCGDLHVLKAFIDESSEGSYLSLQAYVPPSSETDAALLAVRSALQRRICTATTCGYGPRFLHSTGQLHKGDSGQGRFIQIISSNSVDKIIQSEKEEGWSSITFDTLKNAQALGDCQALIARGRPVLTVCVTGDVTKAIFKLATVF